MNGLHLRSLPTAELVELIGEHWKSIGILTESEGLIVQVRASFHIFLLHSLVFACLSHQLHV